MSSTAKRAPDERKRSSRNTTVHWSHDHRWKVNEQQEQEEHHEQEEQ
jgi:hypothetical protein